VPGLTANTAYFAKLVARNKAQVASTASAQATATPIAASGGKVSIGNTAPVSPAVDDLWFDGSNGYELKKWSGSAWVAFQFGTNSIAAGAIVAASIAANTITAAQIAAGTITATQIAALTIAAAQITANTITASKIAAHTITVTELQSGIVVAGIVDATTILGATVIADGSSGEILIYSGTPALGNLVASISGAAGTDGSGNPYASGVEIQSGGLVLDDQASAPAAVSGASTLYTSAEGRLRYKSSSGNDLVLDRSVLDLTNVSMSTQTTPVRMSSILNYLADEASVGSEYEIEIDGTCTSPSTSGVFQFDIFAGGVTFGAGSGVGLGLVLCTVSRVFAWTLRYRLTVEAIGAGGSLKGANTGNNQTSGTLNNIRVNAAFDTTVSQALAIYCDWASVTGTGHSAITYRTKKTRRN
jgi:hypothetical protein